jgi:hypothetical protein
MIEVGGELESVVEQFLQSSLESALHLWKWVQFDNKHNNNNNFMRKHRHA